MRKRDTDKPSEIISKKGYKNYIARGNLTSFCENKDRTQTR